MCQRTLKNSVFAALAAGLAVAGGLACSRPAEPQVEPAPSTQDRAAAAVATAQPAASPTPAASAGHVLARVNGVAITEEDVRLALRLRSPDEPIPQDKQATVLETLIRDELIAQRAAAAGLEQHQSYLQEKAKVEAQMSAMRRRTLGDLYFKTQIEGKAAVDDAAVDRYFAEHKDRLATELHIMQILTRRDTEAFAALEQLKAGKPFADVARAGFAQVPDEKAPPWDLGWLRWRQVPEHWREVVYDLKPGEHSGVIAGPRGRHWIVMVVEKRAQPNVNAREFREQIAEELRGRQVEALRRQLDEELRRGARIER